MLLRRVKIRILNAIPTEYFAYGVSEPSFGAASEKYRGKQRIHRSYGTNCRAISLYNETALPEVRKETRFSRLDRIFLLFDINISHCSRNIVVF